MAKNQTVVLYRLFGDERKLLYVGVSQNSVARLSQHQSGKPWWPEVKTVEFEAYPNVIEARAAETIAIRKEAPQYNVLGNPNAITTKTVDAVRRGRKRQGIEGPERPPVDYERILIARLLRMQRKAELTDHQMAACLSVDIGFWQRLREGSEHLNDSMLRPIVRSFPHLQPEVLGFLMQGWDWTEQVCEPGSMSAVYVE